MLQPSTSWQYKSFVPALKGTFFALLALEGSNGLHLLYDIQ